MTSEVHDDVVLLAGCHALRVYVQRVASGLGLEFDVRNFKTVVLTERTRGGRYRRDRIRIRIARDGTVSTFPKGQEPTDSEAEAIRAEYVLLDLPLSAKATKSKAEDQREALDAARGNWFEILDLDREGVVMCQQRVEVKNSDKKYYTPWTFFSDGQWRQMEPDDDFPLWKPDHHRGKIRLMIHEGAKAARSVDRMLNSLDIEDRQRRAEHPLAEELSHFEHWGWIGGAPNPWRTDWSEVGKYRDLLDVFVVTDNDLEGKDAIKPISRLLRYLQVPIWEVRFDDAFPDHFDFADPLPKEFWSKGRYRGPRLNDLRRSVTWATRQLPKKEGKGGATPQYEPRTSFLRQWVVSTKPLVFVHRDDPGRLLSSDEFNSDTAPFSEVKNTADLMRQEAAIKVNGIAYEPGKNAGTITMDGERLFNTWTPTRIVRRKGDVTRFLDFMHRLIPDETDCNYVLKWIATLIACPHIKMKHGILLISEEQGVGKGTLMEKILAPSVGQHNVSIPNEKMLTDSVFNSWIVRKRLVLVHEIYTGQSKKAYDNIKSWVTEEAVEAHVKYMTEYIIRNWAHFVLSSNSFLALRLVKNDRRWFVPKVTERKQTTSYWVDLNAWLVEEGLEYIQDWAHQYVAEHGSVGPGDDAPMSSAKEKLIEVSRSEGQQLVYDLGLDALDIEQEIVLVDREVQSWVREQRQIQDLNDKKLESPRTICIELRSAGLSEVMKFKVKGNRFVAFANPKAIETVTRNSNGQPPTWESYKSYKKAPKWVADPEERENKQGPLSGRPGLPDPEDPGEPL